MTTELKEKKEVQKKPSALENLVGLYDHLNSRVSALEKLADDNERKLDQVARRLGLQEESNMPDPKTCNKIIDPVERKKCLQYKGKFSKKAKPAKSAKAPATGGY